MIAEQDILNASILIVDDQETQYYSAQRHAA